MAAAALGAMIAVGTPGCYRYRVEAPTVPRGSEPYRAFVSGLLWGAIQPNVTTECFAGPPGVGEPLAPRRVTVTTNLGFILLSVLTLGIWVPAHVEYECMSPPAPPVEEPCDENDL